MCLSLSGAVLTPVVGGGGGTGLAADCMQRNVTCRFQSGSMHNQQQHHTTNLHNAFILI